MKSLHALASLCLCVKHGQMRVWGMDRYRAVQLPGLELYCPGMPGASALIPLQRDEVMCGNCAKLLASWRFWRESEKPSPLGGERALGALPRLHRKRA